MSEAVRAVALTKLFGATPAVVQVDLHLEAGSVTAVLGHNGAGKTTLLRLLATALRPTSGHLEVGGLDANRHARAIRSAVDVMPGTSGAYPELSAAENLRFALAMRGLPGGDVGAALREVGLDGADADPTRTYSSGMLRRLGLARMMLTRPRVALLDEPYAALDSGGRELVDRLICEFRAEGRTVVICTHEERAVALADEVHEMRSGVLVPHRVATVRPPVEVPA